MAGYTQDDIVLAEEECWRLIEGAHIARLATSVSDIPDIYPITAYSLDHTIGFRAHPGTKLASLVTNRRVAVEWDGLTEGHAWSVVTHAFAERLPPGRSIPQFEDPDRPMKPIIEVVTEDWVTITPQVITGRRFPRSDTAD